jgi:hypothetical protein
MIYAFRCENIDITFQYIVTAKDLLSNTRWVSKVLQHKYKGQMGYKSDEHKVYQEFKSLVMKLRTQVKKFPENYDAESITKILLTKRLELLHEYPKVFHKSTESLGWYADKQLIKAYLKGDVYSKEYDIQGIIQEQERISKIIAEEQERNLQLRQQEKAERINKYESEKIPIEKDMIFKSVKDIIGCYPDSDRNNIKDYVRYSRYKNKGYIINEVLIEGKVHPEKLVNL